MRLKFLPLFLALVLPFSLNAEAEKALSQWAQNVREVTLKNGMKFLLYPHGEAPIFSAYIRVKAGGLDEELGKTGLAHFLEHMAFKGTKTLGTRDFAKEKPLLDEIEKRGQELSQEQLKAKPDVKKVEALKAELKKLHEEEMKYVVKEAVSKTMLDHGGVDYNATTSKDVTTYFVNLPSDQLSFWAEFESDRIFKPVFREFYEERDVVMEERRMRVEDDPDGKLYEAFLQTAFSKSPYRWPTIGTMKDINTLTRRDLELFWEKYYQPSNIVGVIVGKIDPDKAIPILEKTFGALPDRKITPTVFPVEPPQTQQKRVTVKFKANPRFILGYHKPTLPSEDDYIFDIIQHVLVEGRTSRLFKRLVLETQIASDVHGGGGVPGSRLPHLFAIDVNLRDGKTTEEALKIIREELLKLTKEGISGQELEKTKNALSMSFVNRLRINEGLAEDLSYYEIVAGSWKYLAQYLDKISTYQSEDVKRVASQYFVKTNETIAELKP